MLLMLITILVGIVSIFILYFKWSFTYWSRKNVTTLEPSIPFGNFQSPVKRTKSIGEQMDDFYFKFKAMGTKHNGIYLFLQPLYMVMDLDNVKNVMTKDFPHFTDRLTYVNEEDDPLSAHLFSLGGVKWRNIRTKLSPTFTSGKMKMMFNTLVECGKLLDKTLETHKKTEIDIKNLLGCFTTDIIGSCAFGLECNTINDEDSLFRKYGKALFNLNKFRLLIQTFCFSFPNFARKLHLSITPPDVSHFFLDVVKDTVKYREDNNVTRNDFLQLLINVKNDTENNLHDGSTLTINEIAAQCFVFFLAGFETSSTTMSFALYELSLNQDIQEKVRDEINIVLEKHNNEITYDSLSEMKYMEQVIEETLRIYPPIPFVTRLCVQDYKIPGSEIVLKKGDTTVIPIMAIHHDKEYYPDPMKFDPERFTEENKKSRHHYAYLPFGEGPRICIGSRFGIMQTKMGLVHILKNYKVTLNPKTVQPIKMSAMSFVTSVEGDIWLDIHKL